MVWRAREFLLESTAWLDYAKRVYQIDPCGLPFLSYVGVNFTSEAIKNYKFYFSFFRRLSEEELAVLLPVADRGRFDEFYREWHPTTRYGTIHRGTTFAVKMENDGSLTHYYHLRVPGTPLGLPERLALGGEDLGNYHGVCEEFTATKTSLKRYYYCRSKQTIAESLQLAGLGDLMDQLPWIDWLEYIESEGRDKMAWISGSQPLIRELVHLRGPPRLYSELAKIRNDCGFEFFGPGSARDGTDHSIYFIQPVGLLRGGGYLFDGVRRFATHHLKLSL